PADAYAFRMVAAVAKGTGAASAYPFAAALVAALLFVHALLELFEQLVQAHSFQRRFGLFAEITAADVLEPIFGDGIGHARKGCHALEVLAKGEIEPVVVFFVLDQ